MYTNTWLIYKIKEFNIMKKKIFEMTKKFIFFIALVSALTPSQVGMFQPECPKILKKNINM